MTAAVAEPRRTRVLTWALALTLGVASTFVITYLQVQVHTEAVEREQAEQAENWSAWLGQTQPFADATEVPGFAPERMTLDPVSKSLAVMLTPYGQPSELDLYLADEVGILERCADLGYTCQADELEAGTYLAMLTDPALTVTVHSEGGAR